ncbi:hypothetical protein GCM10027068_10170 [Prescottella soli]
MDTGSLVNLITSVDVGSLIPVLAPLQDLSNALFKAIGDVIALWPAGSAVSNSSIQAALGSVGGLS